ncbi:MAG: TIM barrel protein [Treponemataceae bacterium]
MKEPGIYLTGFADEAADDLSGQIRVTETLGWNRIEARSIDGTNINDLSDDRFENVCRELSDAGISVSCYGSTIANWGTPISRPFEESLAATDRAATRMRRLGTTLVRIMSYAVLRDRDGRALDDQKEEERFRRLREITRRFLDAGITPVHENCMTYGGMSAGHTLRMLENVPGLKLVFDLGNPPLTPDFTKTFPYPMQSSLAFYRTVKPHIAYVHIKDARWDGERKEERYCFPGEGDGEVVAIVEDLLQSGYDGGFSMEPHMAVVFHDAQVRSSADARVENYVEYGRRFMKLMKKLGKPLKR